MILVDTSSWVQHLRRKDARLVAFLAEHRVRTCDVVVGEVLLGSGLPPNFARDLSTLPRLPSPTAAETRAFIERHHDSVAGAGVGWAELQILLTAAKAGSRLYSNERAIRRVCRSTNVSLA